MTYKLSARKVLLSKQEVTYGTDPVPDGTNGILASNFTVAPMAATIIARDRAHEKFGADPEEIAQKYRTIAFGVEAAGSGTAGLLPPYDVLLQACGFFGTVVVATSVGYILVSGPGASPSATHYFFWDGLKHVMTGSLGNVQLVADGGTLPMFNFTFSGLYAPLTDTAPPADETALASFQNAVEVNDANTQFTLGGFAAVVDKLTIDLGNTVIFRDRPNAARVAITNRKATGSISFEATSVAAKDWLSLAASKTTQALSLICGTVAGNIVTVGAPKVQLGNPTETDLNGVLGFTIPLLFCRNVGDDELSIIFT